MFDKLKKKSIEIICPACKGGQTEPSLAFSTYCRTCGEHLKIIKGIARLNSGPQLSGLSTIRVVSESIPVVKPNGDESKTNGNGSANGNGSNGDHSGNGDSKDAWVKSKKSPEKKKARKKGKRKRERARQEAKKQKPEPEPAPQPEQQPEPAPSEQEIDPPPAEVKEFVEPEPLASVAEVFGLTQVPEESPAEPVDSVLNEPEQVEEEYQLNNESSITLGDRAAAFEELTEGSMAAMISDLVEHEEKREQAKAAQSPAPEEEEESETTSSEPEFNFNKNNKADEEPPEPGILAEEEKPIVVKREVSKNRIKVRCFRCNHIQWESKHAESTQCGRCNTYISLADYHIRQPTDRVIRTRGNVTVHRRGSLIGSELACRDLLSMGTISTKIDCSGEARFKYSASVNGNLHCESLIVEKGTIVEFSEGVYSESVKIYGTLRGDVTCAGAVEITRSGILDGDVIAKQVDLQEGGTLTGEMQIDHHLKVKLPEVKGYDPSIID